MKITKIVLALLLALVLVTGCELEADTASRNLSLEADSFQVRRRIFFYDSINADFIATIEGYCSLGNFDESGERSVTCKTGTQPDGKGIYEKHFLGLSDNVTYFAIQVEPIALDADHYKVIFRPSTIIPDIDIR